MGIVYISQLCINFISHPVEMLLFHVYIFIKMGSFLSVF